jgi:hypothetical protein
MDDANPDGSTTRGHQRRGLLDDALGAEPADFAAAHHLAFVLSMLPPRS